MDVSYKNGNYRLPDFLIIGIAKAGTTALADFLQAHPESGMSSIKEPHFFSYDFIFQRGIPWYAGLFDHCGAAKIIGEASTSYSRIHHHPGVDERIQKSLPHAKIILMVRHPMDRIVSAYIEWLATPNHDQTYESINDALVGMPTFVEASRYWKIFCTYRDRFGEENIHIVWFDDLVAEPNQTYSGVCRFLGINDTWLPPGKSVRSNTRNEVEERAQYFGHDVTAVDLSWNQDSRNLLRRELKTDITNFLKNFDRADLWTDLF